MEFENIQSEPDDDQPTVVEASNEAVRNHLFALVAGGASGMQSFVVDGEVEIWKVDQNKASMVMKIRTLKGDGLFPEWEKGRDFNFDF